MEAHVFFSSSVQWKPHKSIDFTLPQNNILHDNNFARVILYLSN